MPHTGEYGFKINSTNWQKPPETEFKTRAAHELQPCDPTNKVRQYNQILQSAHDGEIETHMIFFSDGV